ncbi:hypothetical protein GH5_08216 [Leishmania sp. Ghana 2012 LV757]|uniref:hypothetical protein n=1 Tax=Leishmania sp. Ghana 2012 LV757 TaxID=2803181 RepID=UPI001B626A54|nr:hypothetical protein GH5_08216 [Leishmania sp. Ghana 2012 LV757]
MSAANIDTYGLQSQPPTQNMLAMRSGNSAEGVFKSREGLTEYLQGGLRSRRSNASYDYLTGNGDEQRPRDADGKYSYHTGKKPTAGNSFDYLDEDQNRLPGAPYTHGGSHSQAHPGDATCFDSDTDGEEERIDHQIRMLEAKQAAVNSRKSANPGPLGLLGFGLSTILLNLHNTGSFPLSTVIVAMGICLGGGAQFIAGLLEWVRGNTFAYVAFTAYGAFWLSLVCVWLLPNTAAGTSTIVMPASEYFLGVYLLLWGIFSFVMLICTIRMNVAIFLVFLTVTLLFLLLGGGNMANNTTALHAAGYEGIICGSLALYLGVAEVFNEVWDRTILPVIPMTQVLGWLGAMRGESATDSAKK